MFDIHFDFRNVKFRRYAVDQTEWDVNETYSTGDVVQITNEGVFMSIVLGGLLATGEAVAKEGKIKSYADCYYELKILGGRIQYCKTCYYELGSIHIECSDLGKFPPPQK
jgi:hypothetical protein